MTEPKDAVSAQTGLRALRVLIADDNEDAADMLAELMRRRGHEVAVAHDGRAAVSSAAEFRPDVALLDIGMPELDGREAAAQIRKQRGCERVLLVAVTGWGEQCEADDVPSATFDHHLTKPIDLERLHGWLSTRQRDKRVARSD